MFDSCQQAYLYFRNSPKRQRFLEHIIESTCPTASQTKKKVVCVKLDGLRDTTRFQLF